MSVSEQITVEGIDIPVKFVRRKSTRSLKLRIKSDGVLAVTIPYGISEARALKFVIEKKDWINQHAPRISTLNPGMHIGKSHSLHFEHADIAKPRSRIGQQQVKITHPLTTHYSDSTVQKIAIVAAERALKLQAESLLPQRIEYLSQKYNVPYKSISVRKLTSRWGSCDADNNITLNIYLLQLDWTLIDYVILHELAHTQHHHHQASFWEFLTSMSPNALSLRKELKTKHTAIVPTRT